MLNRRAGKAFVAGVPFGDKLQRRRKACPPHLVLAGTARGRVANRKVRSRRLCPPYRFLVSGTRSSAPIPTFASFRGNLFCQRRNQRSTRKSMILARFLTLKLLR